MGKVFYFAYQCINCRNSYISLALFIIFIYHANAIRSHDMEIIAFIIIVENKFIGAIFLYVEISFDIGMLIS